MSKAKVVGVGNAQTPSGCWRQLSKAGRGHVLEPRVYGLWKPEVRRDLLLNKAAGIERRAEVRKMVQKQCTDVRSEGVKEGEP